jgi:hypothetical protein
MGAHLDCGVQQPQATCFSTWSLTVYLHSAVMEWAGHVLQHVVFDFQPIADRNRRPEVKNHALKHVACPVVAGCEGRPRVRNHALKHVACYSLDSSELHP